MELKKGIEESQVPKSTVQPMLSSKSKAARKAIDLESQGSWSDSEPSKPWSIVQAENQIIHEELSVQRDRITSVESSLSQIVQQLQSDAVDGSSRRGHRRRPDGSVGMALVLPALTDCRWWVESLLVHSGGSSATRRKATGADHKKNQQKGSQSVW